jgi:hypothetical protein
MKHNGSMIKGESNKNIYHFCHALNNIGFFSYERKTYKIKFRFGTCAFQDPPLCNNTSTTADTQCQAPKERK